MNDQQNKHNNSAKQNTTTNIAQLSKIDFPIFDGTNPQSWLIKAQQFF